jgi:Periplasmic copper-binding protein (NosD)
MRSSATSLPQVTFAALLLLTQLVAVCAHAQTQITSCGTSITEPGEYVLANDLTNCSGYGIVITRAQDVVLNLAGHRITGSDTPRKAGIFVQSSGARIIGPGVISNFTGQLSSGVFTTGSVVEITGVTSTGNVVGFWLNGKVRAHGNIANNNEDGFTTTAEGEFSDNLASGNTQVGIDANGNSHTLFLHNTAVFNGQYGIEMYQYASNKKIISNTALGNGAYDLFEGDRTCRNTWADNTFGSANRPCIH